jgi:protein O-mannosyl-transferase
VWGAECIGVVLLLWGIRRTLERPAIAAVVFFVAVLSPLLGFVPLHTFRYAFVADRYQYLACSGLFALAATSAVRVPLPKLKRPRQDRDAPQ